MKNLYLVAVVDMSPSGIVGTHHVSSTVADSADEAKEWAINDTACDWGRGPDDLASLHVLFVIQAPVGTDLTVAEYDEWGRA